MQKLTYNTLNEVANKVSDLQTYMFDTLEGVVLEKKEINRINEINEMMNQIRAKINSTDY